MKSRQFARLGIPGGDALKIAVTTAVKAKKDGIDMRDINSTIAALGKTPEKYLGDERYGKLAEAVATHYK